MPPNAGRLARSSACRQSQSCRRSGAHSERIGREFRNAVSVGNRPAAGIIGKVRTTLRCSRYFSRPRTATRAVQPNSVEKHRRTRPSTTLNKIQSREVSLLYVKARCHDFAKKKVARHPACPERLRRREWSPALFLFRRTLADAGHREGSVFY